MSRKRDVIAIVISVLIGCLLIGLKLWGQMRKKKIVQKKHLKQLRQQIHDDIESTEEMSCSDIVEEDEQAEI